MGLSSFNAMRARKRAMEQANAKKAEPTPIEVKEVEVSEKNDNVLLEDNETKKVQKKTDAEKLKKKES